MLNKTVCTFKNKLQFIDILYIDKIIDIIDLIDFFLFEFTIFQHCLFNLLASQLTWRNENYAVSGKNVTALYTL